MVVNQTAEFDSAIGYARAIEAKVLEKLNCLEPVAWWNGKETAFFEHEVDGPFGEVTIPLYALYYSVYL